MQSHMQVTPFFDADTYSYSYVVHDAATGAAAVIDPVLDYDPAAGRVSTQFAERIVDFVDAQDLTVHWILETHVHADHLSAARFVQRRLGGRMGISARVVAVQEMFAELFNESECFAVDGRQFDVLFEDGDTFDVGGLQGRVLYTPGHTPACVTYVFEGAAFVGDTLFMPDYGTARADFPGGDARTLYRSIRKILDLPAATTLYMCHDYGTTDRTEFQCATTVAAERAENLLAHDGVDGETFVAQRTAKDAALAPPRLLYPSVQFNMRGARLPAPEANGRRYFKIPVAEQ